jgi:hypothetical protein
VTAAVPKSVFGTSLKLEDGDLALAPGQPDANGRTWLDLVLTSGADNFSQALQVMIGTPFGSDPVNVKYGLDVAAIFTVANAVRSIKDVIRLNLVKSLSVDDRVREIGEIVFDDEAEFALLAPELAGGNPGAVARKGRLWHAVVSFTTIAGGQETIVVSGAAP